MTRDDVFTFQDLAIYARERAKGSAARNDPWAWSYWRQTADWADYAEQDPSLADPNEWPTAVDSLMQAVTDAVNTGYHEGAARAYAHAKWLRIMSQNNGWGIVAPLSLSWLHDLESA